MAFRSGLRTAEAASKANRGAFARATYLSMDDGDSIIGRFVTEAFNRCGHIDDDGDRCELPLMPHDHKKDVEVCRKHGEDTGDILPGWITVDQHGNVPTRDQPEGYEGNWPKSLPAVCRHDIAFESEFEDCYICDCAVNPKSKNKKFRPTARTWSLMCIREEVRDDGEIVGYRDKTRTVKRTIDGKEQEIEEKDLVFCNFGWKNFFGPLSASVEHYGTVLDRDYKITRKGDELDTEYRFVPLDPLDIMVSDLVEIGDDEDEEIRYDLRDPRVMARYESEHGLEDEIARRASDEYYAMFFDERVEQPWSKETDDNKDGSRKSRPKSNNKERDADPDKMRALANRVKGYGSEEAASTEGDSDDGGEDEDKSEDTSSEATETTEPPKSKPARASGAKKATGATKKATSSTPAKKKARAM